MTSTLKNFILFCTVANLSFVFPNSDAGYPRSKGPVAHSSQVYNTMQCGLEAVPPGNFYLGNASNNSEGHKLHKYIPLISNV